MGQVAPRRTERGPVMVEGHEVAHVLAAYLPHVGRAAVLRLDPVT